MGGSRDLEDSPDVKKRPQVRKACVNCQKAHACCEDQRPCKRCVTMGIDDQCFDAERRKRGRKKKSDIEALNSTTIESNDKSSDESAAITSTRRSSRQRNSKKISDAVQNEIEDLEEPVVDQEPHNKKRKNKAPQHPSKKMKLEEPKPDLDEEWGLDEEDSPILQDMQQSFEQTYPPLDDEFDDEFDDNILIPTETNISSMSDFDDLNLMNTLESKQVKHTEVKPNNNVQTSPAGNLVNHIHSASNGNQFEFVQKLLLELQHMKQRMESHTEEVKGLKAQNQALLEQLAMETYKQNVQTKVSFNDLAFSYAYENAGLAMIITSIGGRILSYNKACMKLLTVLNKSHIKYAQELLYNPNDVSGHSVQWRDCYNTNMTRLVSSHTLMLDQNASSSNTDNTQSDEPISYVSTARLVSPNDGIYQDLSYHCSIICDNNKKPLYSLTCVFMPTQNKQYQEQQVRLTNLQQLGLGQLGNSSFMPNNQNITSLLGSSQAFGINTSSPMNTQSQMGMSMLRQPNIMVQQQQQAPQQQVDYSTLLNTMSQFRQL
jgi:hypothetical protein